MKFAAMAGSFLLSCLFLLPLAPAQAKTKTEGIIIHPAYEKTATHSLSDRLFLKEGIRLYTEGHYESALKILQIAFDRGDMKAGRYIGLCFDNGYGVAPDAQLAAHWYQAASLRGDVTATYLLGTLYEKGKGVPQDIQKAMDLYLQSAYRSDHVSAPSQLALGRLYEKGEGTARNLSKARYWYARASKSGNKEAAAALLHGEH